MVYGTLSAPITKRAAQTWKPQGSQRFPNAQAVVPAESSQKVPAKSKKEKKPPKTVSQWLVQRVQPESPRCRTNLLDAEKSQDDAAFSSGDRADFSGAIPAKTMRQMPQMQRNSFEMNPAESEMQLQMEERERDKVQDQSP